MWENCYCCAEWEGEPSSNFARKAQLCFRKERSATRNQRVYVNSTESQTLPQTRTSTIEVECVMKGIVKLRNSG